MVRYAIEYFAAAVATDRAIGDDVGYEVIAPDTVTFLMGRSIELSLKAYLIQRGTPLRTVKEKMGHNLVKCLELAEANNLLSVVPLTIEDRKVVEVLNVTYCSKGLEYFLSGSVRYPIFAPLESLAKRVLQGVLTEIPDSHFHLGTKAGELFASVKA
jgi:hypothetical protein